MAPKGSKNSEKKGSVLALFFFAYTIAAFFKISANIVIPVFQERLEISSSFAGLISGMYYLPYAFLQLFAGTLSRKYGPAKVVAAGFVLAAAGSFAFAFAKTPVMVMAGRVLVGAGVGPVFISIIQYLTENYTGREFALYTGLAVTFSGLGQTIASAPLKILIDLFDITPVFVCISVLMILVSVLLFRVGKKDTRERNSNSISVLRQVGRTAVTVSKSPMLILVTVSWVFYNSIQHSYQGLWSAKWLASAFPAKSGLQGLSATCVSVGLMCGTFFSERLRAKGMSRLKATIRSEYLFALYAIIVIFAHLVSPVMCFITDFLLGFGIGDICIQQTAFVREISDDSISSSITGFMNFCSSLGSLLFQWISGLSVDILLARNTAVSTAYLKTFLVFAAINLVVTVLCSGAQKRG